KTGPVWHRKHFFIRHTKAVQINFQLIRTREKSVIGMFESNRRIGLACLTAEDRFIHYMQIAGGARAFRTQLTHQGMRRHDVVVHHKIETGKLAAQDAPVERVIFRDEVLTEKTICVAPGRDTLLPEMQVIEGLVEL